MIKKATSDSSDRSKNILLTGANGLLGKVCATLLGKTHNVFSLYRSPQAARGVENGLVVDLSAEIDESEIPGDIDVVIHAAQSNHYRDFPNRALDIFNVNVASTAKLLDFAERNQVGQFIYLSSGGVYQLANDALAENHPVGQPGALDYYLSSKLSAEYLVSTYKNRFNTTILRPFFIYGKGQKDNMLIPRLISSVRKGQVVKIQGQQGIRINPVHVSDAARVVERCIELQGHHVINVAGPQIVSFRDILKEMGALLGETPNIQCSDNTGLDVLGDIQKLGELDVVPVVSFKQGLEEML